MGRVHRRGDGPEAEEEDDDAEDNGKSVYEDAEDAGKVEGPPNELVGFARVVRNVGWGSDCAGQTAPEEETLGNNVGCV